MPVKALIKNALTTPRKARPVLDLVRGKPFPEAMAILNFVPRKSARIVKKLLESAAANAAHNYGMVKDNLYIKSIEAQDGLVVKRWLPRAHGHATKILKRRSHITVYLDEVTKSKEEKIARKSKMKTFSYDEVKKIMQEAEKASKMMKDKGKGPGKKDTGTPKDEKISQKEIDGHAPGDSRRIETSRPKFSRLGDRFKSLIHRTTKKG